MGKICRMLLWLFDPYKRPFCNEFHVFYISGDPLSHGYDGRLTRRLRVAGDLGCCSRQGFGRLSGDRVRPRPGLGLAGGPPAGPPAAAAGARVTVPPGTDSGGSHLRGTGRGPGTPVDGGGRRWPCQWLM